MGGFFFFVEQNDFTPPICGELSEYTDSAHTEVEDLSSRCMNGTDARVTDAGTTPVNFILPAPPVRWLPDEGRSKDDSSSGRNLQGHVWLLGECNLIPNVKGQFDLVTVGTKTNKNAN